MCPVFNCQEFLLLWLQSGRARTSGTIPNKARNEFSTSYTMYIVCLLLLLWLQSGCARTRGIPNKARNLDHTLCTLIVYCWLLLALQSGYGPDHPQQGFVMSCSTSYTMYNVCLLLLLWLQSGRARTREASRTRLVTSSPPATRVARGSPTGVTLDTRY